jgi:hypothetical protein
MMRRRCTRWLVVGRRLAGAGLAGAGLAGVCLAGGSVSAQVSPGGLGWPVHRTEVRETLPFWLEMPRTARIWTADGLDAEPLYNSAVTLESLRLGVLVGALRNTGTCSEHVRLRLQYVDRDWQPMGPAIENEARVSRADPGGLLPYRFRLQTIDDRKTPPAAFVIVVDSLDTPQVGPFRWNRWVDDSKPAGEPQPCAQTSRRVETTVTRRLPMREGFRLEGTVTLAAGPPLRADAMVVTALLQDENDQVLEVLVGTPTFRSRDHPDGVLREGQSVPFVMRTDIPLGRSPRTVTVMVELLPDADVAPEAGLPR